MKFINQQYQEMIEMAQDWDPEFGKTLELMLSNLTEEQKKLFYNCEKIDDIKDMEKDYIVAGEGEEKDDYLLGVGKPPIYYLFTLDLFTEDKLKRLSKKKKQGEKTSVPLMQLIVTINKGIPEELNKLYFLYFDRIDKKYMLKYTARCFKGPVENKDKKIQNDVMTKGELTKKDLKNFIALGEITDGANVGV